MSLEVLNNFDFENNLLSQARKDIEKSMFGTTTSPMTSSEVARDMQGPNSFLKLHAANAAAREAAKREFEEYNRKVALRLAQERESLRAHAHAPGKASVDEIEDEKEQRLEQVKAINTQQVKLDNLIVAEEELEDLIQARDALVNDLQAENAAQRNNIVNDIADVINNAGVTGRDGNPLMDEAAREILRNVATGPEMLLYNAMHPELRLIPQSTEESAQARASEQAQINQQLILKGLTNIALRTYFIHQIKNNVDAGVDESRTLQQDLIKQLNQQVGHILKPRMESSRQKLTELAEKQANSLADLKKRNAQIQDRRARADENRLKLDADVARAYERPLAQKQVVKPVNATVPNPFSTKLRPPSSAAGS